MIIIITILSSNNLGAVVELAAVAVEAEAPLEVLAGAFVRYVYIYIYT